jgi:hypothetical protein
MIERRKFLLGAAAASGMVVRPVLAVSAAVAAADKEFVFAGNVLGVGPPGRCDDFRLGGPVVRWDETLKLWRMWYYCRRTFCRWLALATNRWCACRRCGVRAVG